MLCVHLVLLYVQRLRIRSKLLQYLRAPLAVETTYFEDPLGSLQVPADLRSLRKQYQDILHYKQLSLFLPSKHLHSDCKTTVTLRNLVAIQRVVKKVSETSDFYHYCLKPQQAWGDFGAFEVRLKPLIVRGHWRLT